MRRREFIGVLGGAAAWPMVAHAQQAAKVYRIGFLANDPTIPMTPPGRAFVDGLREKGFVEGENIIIERRFAEGRLDRLSDLAIEIVRLGVDVMVTSSSEATLAAKHATTSIPIVMLNVADPLSEGVVADLAHPDGNVTGLAQTASAEIAGKRLQLLKNAVPGVSRVAVLVSPSTEKTEERFLELAAQSLQIELHAVSVHSASEISDALAELNRNRPDALFVTNSALGIIYRKLIVDRAAESRLPTISGFRETTEAGGLMSYGADRSDLFRRAAIYVEKILKGAKPGDLPVEQPTKYELVVNLKTARRLNLEIPRTLLLLADEVIE
jgi:putative tryptophan/tyrosine transport system substrate-binding protein